MKFFADTADVNEIRELAATGLLDGVTTNPSLVAKSGRDFKELIAEIRDIYDNYEFDTEILAASIRSANHVKEAALIGADVVTAPPSVLKSLVKHPLTDKGMDMFLADWKKTGQSI